MTRTGHHALLTKFHSLMKSDIIFHQNICRKARLQVCLSNQYVCLFLWIFNKSTIQISRSTNSILVFNCFSPMFPVIFRSDIPNYISKLIWAFFETCFLLCLISLGLYLLRLLTSNLARFFRRSRSTIEVMKVWNYARKSENTLKTIIWEWKNTLWSFVRLAALLVTNFCVAFIANRMVIARCNCFASATVADLEW